MWMPIKAVLATHHSEVWEHVSPAQTDCMRCPARRCSSTWCLLQCIVCTAPGGCVQELQGRLRTCSLESGAHARRRSCSHSPDRIRCSSPSRQLRLEATGCQACQSSHSQSPASQSRHSSPSRAQLPGTTGSASGHSPGLTRVSRRQSAQLPAAPAAAVAPGSTAACACPARRAEPAAGGNAALQDAAPAGGGSEHHAARLTSVGAEQAACVSAAGWGRSVGGQPVQPGRHSSSQPGVAAAQQPGLPGPVCEGWRASCSLERAPSRTAGRPCWVPPSRSPDSGSHHIPAMAANCQMGTPQIITTLQPSSEGQRRTSSRKAFSALHRLQVGSADVSVCRGLVTLLLPTLMELPFTQVQRFRLAEI